MATVELGQQYCQIRPCFKFSFCQTDLSISVSFTSVAITRGLGIIRVVLVATFFWQSHFLEDFQSKWRSPYGKIRAPVWSPLPLPHIRNTLNQLPGLIVSEIVQKTTSGDYLTLREYHYHIILTCLIFPTDTQWRRIRRPIHHTYQFFTGLLKRSFRVSSDTAFPLFFTCPLTWGLDLFCLWYRCDRNII